MIHEVHVTSLIPDRTWAVYCVKSFLNFLLPVAIFLDVADMTRNLLMQNEWRHHVDIQTCLQVKYSQVESSLELVNARVRVESRVAGRNIKSSQVKSIYNERALL